MLHLGTIALSALFVLCSAAAPASFFEKQTDLADPVAYEQTEALDAVWETERITYTTRTVTRSHLLAIMYPSFNYSPAVGSCGCIAGANVLGFYDRYYENLIPNHDAGTMYSDMFLYNTEDSAVVQVIETLYEYMGTEHVGTTEDEFLDGMRRYCNEKGRTISFSSCMSSNSFDFSSAQRKMEANQPIILFLSGYNTVALTTEGNTDIVSYRVSDVNHIMIAFGYSVVDYVTSSGVITYNFFDVATGLSGMNIGLYDINYKTKINDALAVNIY